MEFRLQALFDQMIAEGFARPATRQHFSVVNSVGRLFDILDAPDDTARKEHPERI